MFWSFFQECTNPCCNATTCTLTQGSQCAAGECCESCKVRAQFSAAMSEPSALLQPSGGQFIHVWTLSTVALRLSHCPLVDIGSSKLYLPSYSFQTKNFFVILYFYPKTKLVYGFQFKCSICMFFHRVADDGTWTCPQILPPSRECRRKQDDCDLAEYCSGTSPNCPEDVFSVNGVPCEGDRGYCFDGQCPRKEAQCVKMYGPCEWAKLLPDLD